MREQQRDKQRLLDILSCISNIEQYVKAKSFEEIVTDSMCYHAVVYNIMIIGEAANMTTKEFKENHPSTEWRNIIGMRNFLIHGYYAVEKGVIKDVLNNDLPMLKSQVQQYLKEFEYN